MKRAILDNVLSETPKNILYHYTTLSGLKGIVESGEIWATHSQYLNDTREFIHALEMAWDELTRAIRRAKPSRANLLSAMKEGLARPDGTLGDIGGIVCVSSFSEDGGDSLSQWRGYARSGSGFAIGIQGERLAALANANKFFLARCIYGEKAQRRLIRALIEEVVEENTNRHREIDSAENPDTEAFVLGWGGNFRAYLYRYAPILKSPAFRDEREWRLISRPQTCTAAKFAFREGTSTLIPYYKFPLRTEKRELPIHEVVVGPTETLELSARSMKLFLLRQDLRGAGVRRSAVSYRHW